MKARDLSDVGQELRSLLAPPAWASMYKEILEITPLSYYVSGEAAFVALKSAVDEMVSTVPTDHDVLIQAFDISITDVRYTEPHTLIFSGFDHNGHKTSVVAHYSQLIARVVYMPKRGAERVITGFARTKEAE